MLQEKQPAPQNAARQPLQIRVPFLQQQVGLGDAIKSMTQAAGIQPCSPCEQRRREMNQRVVFNPWTT